MQEIFISFLFLLVRLNILNTSSHMVPDSQNAQGVFWIDEESVIVNQPDRYFTYNISTRKITESDSKEDNSLYGKDFLCGWSNKEIRSEDEYSTRFTKEDYEGNRILDIELKPTLEVIECGNDVVLRTVPPISEEVYLLRNRLFFMKKYFKRILSPKISKVLLMDDFGNYWITEFRF